jgi:signal peptidase I
MTDPLAGDPIKELAPVRAEEEKNSVGVWTERLVLFLRLMAGVSMLKGLYHWAAVCGFIGGSDDGFLAHGPHRRDVAVFNFATDPSTDFITGVVGLPGDHSQMRHGQLFINDQQVPRRPTEDFVYEEGGSMMLLHQYVESLPRGPGEPPLEHPIIKVGDNGPLDDTPVYDVPPGHYFAMGDNRDNSQDSRVLSAVGYIPFENLVGRAEFVFFSTDGSAHWWEVWKWPFAIRYRRLFRGVG